ncbi:MAG: diacylglycerol kinase family protein [Patescibacteria group bacterium]
MKQPSLTKSFAHAWRGMHLTFQAERNFRIQIAVGLAVILCSWAFPLTHTERLVLLIVTMMVIVLELLNTAVERLVDLMKPRLIDVAGDIKDVMAGAVLLASLFAIVIGVAIFSPHILYMIRRV